MRVTGGSLRGRTIRMPGGAVRPTQDRVREALFSILAPRIGGARFLDLFAGAGCVGLEAWSRGAEWVCWVEASARVARVLRENVAALCPGAGGRVACREALRFLGDGTPDAPYDIIYADPPYGEGGRRGGGGAVAGPLLAAVRAGGWLAPEGLVVLEQSARDAAAPAEGWTVGDERTYGAARLVFYRA